SMLLSFGGVNSATGGYKMIAILFTVLPAATTTLRRAWEMPRAGQRTEARGQRSEDGTEKKKARSEASGFGKETNYQPTIEAGGDSGSGRSSCSWGQWQRCQWCKCRSQGKAAGRYHLGCHGRHTAGGWRCSGWR